MKSDMQDNRVKMRAPSGEFRFFTVGSGRTYERSDEPVMVDPADVADLQAQGWAEWREPAPVTQPVKLYPPAGTKFRCFQLTGNVALNLNDKDMSEPVEVKPADIEILKAQGFTTEPTEEYRP